MRGDRARSALTGTRFEQVEWVEETGSTNRDLLARAGEGAPEGLVLVADHQTAGRGRLDRQWQAPAGSSLLVSILFRPALPVTEAHLLTTAVAVSAVEACAALAGVDVRLKWPNDLVIDLPGDGGVRKVGGILAESTVDRRQLSAVVVGLGLNVNWPADLPDELTDLAVALNHLVGQDLDREALLAVLLGGLDRWYGELADPAGPGRIALMARARELSATLGRRVRVELDGEDLEGDAVALDDDGALVIEIARGDRVEQRRVVAGDVVHLRPID